MVLKHAAAFAAAAVALAVPLAAQGTRAPRFIPPRLITGALPPLPGPNILGGGEVLIQGIVDRRGALTRPTALRVTPPYTEFILDAISRWQFEPARDVDYRGVETTVEMPVSIMAIYRPPILMNAPTVSEPPKDLMKPSGDLAYPTTTAMPNYPPLAFDGGVVLFEVALDESGAVTDTRGVGPMAGFASASREALVNWRFKGGLYRARPVPMTAYVLFGFRPPTGYDPPCRPDDERPACKCLAKDDRLHCRPPKPPAAVPLPYDAAPLN